MGISKSEYRQMLADNPALQVIDDGGLRNAGDLGAPAERALELAGAPRAPRPPTEHDEQVALFAWAAMNEAQHPELTMLAAIPNGGYRPMATAAMLKQEGVKAGYPDILLDVARGDWHGLRIELKRADRSNGPTPEQKDWISRLRGRGYCAVICYGAQEAIGKIMAYLSQE